MRTADFDYAFPQELIAQRPTPERGDSRMLHLDRATGTITHRAFHDFPALLRPDDVMVVNASRVIKARLHGRRENGRMAEILLVHPDVDDTWLAMAHPGGKLKAGRTVTFDDETQLEIVDVVGGGLRRVRLRTGNWSEVMARYGAVPLPPYIERGPEPDDADRYQTVYARADGSVAAPTAGLPPAGSGAGRDRKHSRASARYRTPPRTAPPKRRPGIRESENCREWPLRSEATGARVLQSSISSPS